MYEAEPFPLVRSPVVETPPLSGSFAPTAKRLGGLRAFQQELLGFGVISIVSLGIGLLVNGRRAHPLPLGYASAEERLGRIVARMSAATSVNPTPTPALRSWQNMGLDEFQEFVATRRGLVMDARAPTFYQAGHVPGALSLPREDFEKSYALIRASLERDHTKPVVVYCSETDCEDSELVAEALYRLGYPHLFVYKAGWEEWSRAGLPQEAGQGP